MLSIKETAEILNLSYRTVFKFVKEGRIKAVRVGRKWLIKEQEIEKIKNNGIE